MCGTNAGRSANSSLSLFPPLQAVSPSLPLISRLQVDLNRACPGDRSAALASLLGRPGPTDLSRVPYQRASLDLAVMRLRTSHNSL
jgi:hypothetical protein